ncbi:MAG: ThuA domain-containing protein, partial [Aureliella sp.]
LSESYHSYALNRGFIMKVAPDGSTTALASGLRSPGGIGFDEHQALFYVESQGPWNCSCSLKAVSPGSFHGHPASFKWYDLAPELGSVPEAPKPGTRIATEKKRIPQLVPYAVVFPYLRMGRSITGFCVDQTHGKFGPFENQMFLGDFTQSILMRATTEQINGVWQGACYPFREGLSTGILNVQFTPGGKLLCGGTNRGWPVRGIKPFALERVEWSGKMPFEINRVTIEPEGFKVTFTKPVDQTLGSRTDSYVISAFTHPYHGAYGGPEIEQHHPGVTAVSLADDGLTAHLSLEELKEGFVYELDLARLRSREQEELLHRNAFYTVNEIPAQAVAQHASADSPWLSYAGGHGPGAGKHIVLIAADQEYRSEQSMPMLAKVLAEHHGFNCTVLFGVNERGQVDPTLPVTPKKGEEARFKGHNIPGLEHLESADLAIFFTRMLTLPADQQAQIVRYLDSGKPIIGLRTANHGFLKELPYKIDGRQVQFGNHILGGTFLNHHGNWSRDSTRGDIVAEAKDHPILRGVRDIWGTSDVYRTYKPGGHLPEGCTPLVLGQPLLGREPNSPDNPQKEPLPVAWIKTWQTSQGQTARVFHSTMGSGQDFENEGLRRLVVNAAYWCLGMEDDISPTSSVEPVGQYKPLPSGFNYEKLGVTSQLPQVYK